MEKVVIGVIAFTGMLALVIGVSFLFSWLVMWLWNNALVGAVAGVSEVSWVQAWGILILSSLLFKNTSTTKKD
jgi:hypothetical protein